jgi:hypothetical protein
VDEPKAKLPPFSRFGPWWLEALHYDDPRPKETGRRRDAGWKANELVVAMFLASKADNKTREVKWRIAKIAKHLGIHRNKISEAIARLEGLGIITTFVHRGAWAYRMNIAKPDAPNIGAEATDATNSKIGASDAPNIGEGDAPIPTSDYTSPLVLASGTSPYSVPSVAPLPTEPRPPQAADRVNDEDDEDDEEPRRPIEDVVQDLMDRCKLTRDQAQEVMGDPLYAPEARQWSDQLFEYHRGRGIDCWPAFVLSEIKKGNAPPYDARKSHIVAALMKQLSIPRSQAEMEHDTQRGFPHDLVLREFPL